MSGFEWNMAHGFDLSGSCGPHGSELVKVYIGPMQGVPIWVPFWGPIQSP